MIIINLIARNVYILFYSIRFMTAIGRFGGKLERYIHVGERCLSWFFKYQELSSLDCLTRCIDVQL